MNVENINNIQGYLAKLNHYPNITRFDLAFLAVNIIIGSAIHINFSSGYWILLFNTILTGVGYILLASSLAEMTSALPFSGGIYGVVRAFIHPFVGFYVACFELLINVFYLTLSVRYFSLLPIHSGYFAEDSYLANCVVIYVVILSVCLLGGKVFWWSNSLIGVTCLTIILIYILGGASHANFSAWKHTDQAFTIKPILQYLPESSLSYLGIQYLPLASKLLPEARKDVPIVMMGSIAFLFMLIIAVITVASSISPGFDELSAEDHPLIFGFSRIFGTSVYPSHLFGLPGLLSACFSFMYCFGRQASTMAGSGLLPPSFLWTLPGFGTPYVPLIIVTLVAFVLDVFSYIFEDTALAEVYLFICCMSTYIVFVAFFVAYIQFIDHYSSLQRYYRSPFGKIGAVIGILIFGFCMVGLLGFQESGYVAIVVLSGISLLIIGIFKFILKGSHEFSEEEKNELFKAYLITANKISKNRIRNRSSQVASKSSNPGGSANASASATTKRGGSSSCMEPNSSNGGASRTSDIEENSPNLATIIDSRRAESTSGGMETTNQKIPSAGLFQATFGSNKVQPSAALVVADEGV